MSLILERKMQLIIVHICWITWWPIFVYRFRSLVMKGGFDWPPIQILCISLAELETKLSVVQTHLTDSGWVVNITNWHNWYSQIQLLRLPSTETWDGVHVTESWPLIGRKDIGGLSLAAYLVIVKHGVNLRSTVSRLTFNQDKSPQCVWFGSDYSRTNVDEL